MLFSDLLQERFDSDDFDASDLFKKYHANFDLFYNLDDPEKEIIEKFYAEEEFEDADYWEKNFMTFV